MPKKALSTRMRYATWERDFRPIKNPHREHASLNGFGFETYDAELEQVLEVARTEPDRVWTVVDCDGKWYIVNGYHLVNRVVYAITEVPCDRPELSVSY
jgi:hypothetical protein